MRQYVGFGSKQSKYHKNYHMIYKLLEEKMIIMGSRIKKSHFQETARSWAEEDSNAFFHEKYVSILMFGDSQNCQYLIRFLDSRR